MNEDKDHVSAYIDEDKDHISSHINLSNEELEQMIEFLINQYLSMKEENTLIIRKKVSNAKKRNYRKRYWTMRFIRKSKRGSKTLKRSSLKIIQHMKV